MVSVVLPTYNREKYLPQAIESVINQTIGTWELIVVDDCSTDSTSSIVKQYQQEDRRIKYHKNERNMKLPASLNVGFRMTLGEYLTWFPDDDFFRPNAIEVMSNALAAADDDVGLVFSDYDIVDENGDFLRHKIVPDDVNALWWDNIIGGHRMYRRKCYEMVGDYAEDLFLVEDYEYFLRIFKYFKIMPIHQTLFDFRAHDATLSKTRAREVQEKKLEILKDNLKWPSLSDNIKANIHRRMATIYYGFDEYDKMREHIGEMKKLDAALEIPRRVRRAMFLGDTLTGLYKKMRISLRW